MKTLNRWIILAACVAANLCIGSAYAWSVFQNPLIEEFGFTTSQANLAYTISLFLVPFAMILSGKLQARFGARKTIVMGGIIFGAGVFLTGFITGIIALYLTYGLLGGVGIGIVYGCTIPNAVKWFPDKRGLSGGIIAGGFGCGSVLFAPLAVNLINSLNILATFRIMGIVYVVVIVLTTLFITAAPENYKPKGWTPPAPVAGNTAVNFTTIEMLKKAKFWVLWLIYTIGCIAGLMIIGHASPIGQERIGITPEMAAVVIVFLAISNTAGRMLWGAISDFIGRYRTLILMFILTAGMLLLLNAAGSYWLFVVSVMGIAVSFGGFVGVFPSITADNFGALHLGINYGAMFSAYGFAAVIGPLLASEVREASGDYSLAFIIASIMTIAGIALTIYISLSTKKKAAS
jgi:OFA family oxalate/formate antiporter-like MFS transporter